MARNQPIKAYNDGLVQICREKAVSSDFGARKSPTSVEDLDHLCTLAFCEQSRRGQDVEYAHQMGYQLDRKISTRRPPRLSIDTQCDAIVGDVLYHISDVDQTSTELYLSLTEVRRLNVDQD